ncbi:hypothetical protein BC830DRAFT_1071155 [Chytriomyces sp. MP71]|nr:hypothetical protein BC830DRAFT_1071155 [Chytriomyces sp. MP71]
MNYNPPPPPPGKSPNDFLSLAFYYHEDGNLELSAFYIKKAAAADAHPLALHLLGLLRRHGWGIAHSPRKAFSSSSAPSRVSATQSESLSRSSVVTISILPLPLFEIGVCFQQGWGIAKSIPAAFYFYKAAAALGDPDACYELGYLILHRVNRERAFGGGKREAARWLRKAHEAGRAVVGESWIFKRKWGGSDP